MALTLAKIQSLVQFYANDATLNLLQDPGLTVANLVYQSLCAPSVGGLGRRWPELTQVATPIITVAGQENYLWPINPLFKEEPFVDWLNVQSYNVKTTVSVQSVLGQPVLQVASAANVLPYDAVLIDSGIGSAETGIASSVDAVSVPNTITLFSNLASTHNIGAVIQAAKGTPYQLDPAYNEAEWSRLGILIKGWPRRYRRITVNGSPILSIRPVPSVAGNLIRLSGLIQAADLTVAGSTTVFLEVNNDRALACLIAAEYKFKRGEGEAAQGLITRAGMLLPQYDYNPPRQKGYVTPWGLPANRKRYDG